MSLLIVSLLVVGAALVGAKVYFQEKEKQAIENQKAEAAEQNLTNSTKTNEEIVAERLAEIAEFEKEIDVIKEEKKEVIAPAPVANKSKSKPNAKKYYKPKKQQPKIKAK